MKVSQSSYLLTWEASPEKSPYVLLPLVHLGLLITPPPRPPPRKNRKSPGPSVVPLFDPITSQASSHEVGLLCRPLPVWNSRKQTGLNH